MNTTDTGNARRAAAAALVAFALLGLFAVWQGVSLAWIAVVVGAVGAVRVLWQPRRVTDAVEVPRDGER